MKDLLLDTNRDLVIKAGDLAMGEADAQHIELFLDGTQGEWKERPDIGVNLYKSKSGVINRFSKRDIREQLTDDGFKINDLIITTDEGIKVTGSYETGTNTQ